MKRTLLATISMLLLSSAVAVAQRIMKVEKTDGTIIAYPVADVARVYFEDITPEPTPEPTPGTDPAVEAGLCPDSNHPHMIDLGIGTLWSCCNVGASAPEKYGDYYAWGETQPKSVYNWSTYIHCDGSSSTCHNIGSDISGTQYDAARANWGAPWRMPTSAEIQTLLNSCTSVWTTFNGVYGRKFTGPNGGTIFLPAAGYREGGELSYAGSYGNYWSSTLSESFPDRAYSLFFHSGDAYWSNFDGFSRGLGRSVRPVG